MELTTRQIVDFERDGYLVLPHFISDDDCAALREHAASLEENLRTDRDHVTVFSAGHQAHGYDSLSLIPI